MSHQSLWASETQSPDANGRKVDVLGQDLGVRKRKLRLISVHHMCTVTDRDSEIAGAADNNIDCCARRSFVRTGGVQITMPTVCTRAYWRYTTCFVKSGLIIQGPRAECSHTQQSVSQLHL